MPLGGPRLGPPRGGDEQPQHLRVAAQSVGREAFCGGEAGEEVSNDRNSAQLNALAALSIEDLVPRCARTRRHILFLRKLRERYGNSSTPCSRREFVRQVYRKVHGRVAKLHLLPQVPQ